MVPGQLRTCQFSRVWKRFKIQAVELSLHRTCAFWGVVSSTTQKDEEKVVNYQGDRPYLSW